MSDLDSHGPAPGDRHTGLFASLILQQSNMALMFLGKVPHPDTGKTAKDLQSARIFIDLLEMLDIKTKGNLSPQENHMLKDSLTSLRMAFVEAANAAPTGSAPAAEPAPSATPTTPEDSSAAPSASSPEPAPSPEATEASQAGADEESKKKFTKKY